MPLRARQFSLTPHAPDADGICAAQTTAGAGSMTLNGVDVKPNGVASFRAASDTILAAYQIGIASTGNISGVNFTVTGTDEQGAAVTETLAGPNNNTVETSEYFATVSSVTVDGAVGTNTTVGTVDEFITSQVPLDIYTPQTSSSVHPTGTINYAVDKAYERVTAGYTPNWVEVVTGQTADWQETFNEQLGSMRLVVASFSAGATLAWNISQGLFR